MNCDFAFILLCLIALSACGKDDDGMDKSPVAEADASLVYASHKQVWKAEILEVPGGDVSAAVQLEHFNESGDVITVVSISPNAQWAVFTTVDSTAVDSRDWTGAMFVYDFKTAQIFKSLDKSQLTTLLNFPSQDAAMQFIALGWQNDSVLIAHVRPRTDFLPIASSNLSYTYSIKQGTVLSLLPSASSQPFAIPIIPNERKLKFEHGLVDGQIVVAQQVVGGTALLTHYDITFR